MSRIKSNKYPIARKTDVVLQELGEEVLIYNLQNNKAFCLNETSAMVWKLCDGTNSVQDICLTIGRKSNSQVSEDLVWLALDGLLKENLLENGKEFSFKIFDGTSSRREVIKKIGLGSMIALPVVSSLVAPLAIHAQTCIPPGQPCGFVEPANCCSNPNYFCEGGFCP